MTYGEQPLIETLFDKILAKKIPANIVYEDEDILAFKDIHPQARTHVLVVPKRRAASLNDIRDWPTNDVGVYFQKVAHVAKHLGLDKNGFRIVMNTGRDGGQTVDYAHVHILGGETLDGGFA